MVIFRFTLPTGEVVVGPVQGAGGVVCGPTEDALQRLLASQRIAAEGRGTGCYEPEPGCISVHTTWHALGSTQRTIPLVGSVIDLADAAERGVFEVRSQVAAQEQRGAL